MKPHILLLPGAVSDLYAQASFSGCVTLADKYGLMAAIFEESLSEEEKRSIDRLLRAVSKGRLKVVDEISAIASYPSD